MGWHSCVEDNAPWACLGCLTGEVEQLRAENAYLVARAGDAPLGAIKDVAATIANLRTRLAAADSCDQWRTAAQTAIDTFDPMKPGASPATLVAVVRAAKDANATLRAKVANRDAEIDRLRARMEPTPGAPPWTVPCFDCGAALTNRGARRCDACAAKVRR